MSAGTLLRAAPVLGWRQLRETASILLLGLGVLALLFHAETAAAVKVWWESTAYNHCFLVLPIAAWLAWDRRERLAGVPVRPAPWVALAAFPLAAVWLAAERLGIMEGRQLAAMGLLELLFLAVLGWRMWRRLAAPLLYLFFLVPFGDFIVPYLQHFTWRFAVIGLNLLGIPNFATGATIEIPEGTFYIAEACAGLRFLIASIAFGALYACLMYRSPWRRLLFIAAAILVPVIANGLRAFGIIWLGHALGSAQAAATDHVLYGWLFFSIVILALTAAGAPFRQVQGRGRPEPAAYNQPPGRPLAGVRCLAAAAAVLALAGLGPALGAGLDRAAAAPPAIPADVLAGLGCTAVPETADVPLAAGRTFACATPPLTLQLAVFPARVTLGPVLAAERRLVAAFSGDEANVVQFVVAGPVPQVWRLVEMPKRIGAAAAAVWIAGGAASGDLRSRLRQAWISLAGPAYAPVVVAIVGKEPNSAALIRAFLTDHPELSARMARLSANYASPRKTTRTQATRSRHT